MDVLGAVLAANLFPWPGHRSPAPTIAPPWVRLTAILILVASLATNLPGWRPVALAKGELGDASRNVPMDGLSLRGNGSTTGKFAPWN